MSADIWVILSVVAPMILVAYLVIVWLPGLRSASGRQIGWGILFLGIGGGLLWSSLSGWSHPAYVSMDATIGFLLLAVAAYKFWGPVSA